MYAALASRMSVNDSHEMEAAQRAFCRERNAHFVNAPSDSKPGFALVTEESRPMNGLRDPPAGDTNGWYIWFGEELSTKKNGCRHQQRRHPAYNRKVELYQRPDEYMEAFAKLKKKI